MNKLKLQLEQLRVETFDVSGADPGVGTVYGHYPTLGDSCTCFDCGFSEYKNSCHETQCDGTQCVVFCPYTDTCTDPSQVETCLYTCSPCNVSENEVHTCYQPC